ncbi:serine/threonine-protein phosphatase 7 long form homolog [Triticum dicoccoides]|uniref:serine/threonine-protein phosphatase 7 long form homolog n=1 Tax=Triticum dicoccoides TaxID=85692 RepID=UPI0018908253|nr:serine/threonine-protein phosphatase 7 long form homolog [Triticum dicoccoides]
MAAVTASSSATKSSGPTTPGRTISSGSCLTATTSISSGSSDHSLFTERRLASEEEELATWEDLAPEDEPAAKEGVRPCRRLYSSLSRTQKLTGSERPRFVHFLAPSFLAPSATLMADGDGPWYDGLIDEWDKEHRARAIENGQVVVAMRMRGHSADDFDYDPRYEPYIRRLGLLPFVLQFKRRAPPVNHAALTALVDRWRPETHSFHLPCGELTMTLQDMAMISGLPINGQAVTGRVSVGNWRERTADLIGVQPEDPQEGKADTAKVRHSWLKLVRGNTNPCPQDANDVVVQQYARAYLWYVLTKVVFSDATGNSALWMFLEPLNNWDTQYSWGSAALAYLYRQLDLACRRKGGTSSLSGFVWSLSVWMWERIPVGRPDLKNPLMANPRGNHDGLHDDDPYRRPTLAYYWEQVTVYTGSSHVRYKCYMNELDTLTAEQVHWLPYVEDCSIEGTIRIYRIGQTNTVRG